MGFSSARIGGWGFNTEGAPTGDPSPAPSTRTARTARTTRQINGVNSLAARPNLGGLHLPPLRGLRPTSRVAGCVLSQFVFIFVRKTEGSNGTLGRAAFGSKRMRGCAFGWDPKAVRPRVPGDLRHPMYSTIYSICMSPLIEILAWILAADLLDLSFYPKAHWMKG